MFGRFRPELLSLIAGASLPLAFAPLNLFVLALLAPATLFVLWRDATPMRAARLGFLFGLGMFGVGVSWVYVTMHVFGRMAPPLAVIATAMFVSVLAAFPALLGYTQSRLRQFPLALRYLVIMPVLWVLLEWVRAWVLTGFPWLNLGYSQMLTPLKYYAPWLGVYGVSYFVALSAGVFAWLWCQRVRKVMFISATVLLALWLAPLLLSQIQWVTPVDRPLRIALVQGNVAIQDKWRPENRDNILNMYLNMSQQARDADAVVWPEGAIPTYLQYLDPVYLGTLRQEAAKFDTDFMFGTIELDSGRNGVYYNSAVVLGKTPGIYRKVHLVPFGEYPPFDPLFRWVMQSMHIPMANFTAGPEGQKLLTLAGQPIATSICYENVFGEELIHMLPQATLLVNVSENAWYGNSLAAHQLVQMAQMRSLEFGRPVVRADNAGPSVAIDHLGRIQKTTRPFEARVLMASVQPMSGATPYVLSGNYPILIWLLLNLVLLYGYRRRR